MLHRNEIRPSRVYLDFGEKRGLGLSQGTSTPSPLPRGCGGSTGFSGGRQASGNRTNNWEKRSDRPEPEHLESDATQRNTGVFHSHLHSLDDNHEIQSWQGTLTAPRVCVYIYIYVYTCIPVPPPLSPSEPTNISRAFAVAL